MDPESKKLLEETFRLSEENNRMLKRIRKVQKWTTLLRVLYALIVVGIAVGAFYYLNPYVDGLLNIYTGMSGVEEKLTGGGGSFQEFLSNFQN
jgi:hypothetical protein